MFFFCMLFENTNIYRLRSKHCCVVWLSRMHVGVGLVVYPAFSWYSFAAAFDNMEAFCAIQASYTIAAYCLGAVSFFDNIFGQIFFLTISLDRFFAFSMRLRYHHQIVTFNRIVFLLTAFCFFGLTWPSVGDKHKNRQLDSRYDSFNLRCDYIDFLMQNNYGIASPSVPNPKNSVLCTSSKAEIFSVLGSTKSQ